MAKNLEELSSREITIDVFKRLRFRGKLKLCSYDWACNMAWWPGYLGIFAGGVIKYNPYALSSYGRADNLINTVAPFLAGAAIVSALRTGYCIAKDSRKIKKIKDGTYEPKKARG